MTEDGTGSLNFVFYNSEVPPETVATSLKELFEDVSIESNYLGDVTDEMRHSIYEPFEIMYRENESIRDQEMDDLLFEVEEAVWIYDIRLNPSRETLELENLSRGVPPEYNLEDFEETPLPSEAEIYGEFESFNQYLIDRQIIRQDRSVDIELG